jgi:hypothetical protein
MGTFVILGYFVHFSRDLDGITVLQQQSKKTDDIRLNLEDRQATVLVMLDFTQAFDMIAHDLMVCKMRGSQRYSDQAQCAKSDVEFSTVRGIEYCVPQDSGSLLFISFIDDGSGVIHFCRFLIYADDLQIYHSSSVADFQRCYNELNADLKWLYERAGYNGLKLNPKQSKVILIQRGW